MKQINLFLVFTNSALAVINFGLGNYSVATFCVVAAVLCAGYAAVNRL